ncbi:hypothetical protein [Clostridium sp. 'White wine YQ']|uniref:hypothetical protein n=1 Tax=Clostridium sp. 'White wine YQ' TaxID=3027474 RepID=UPI00236672C1|nr:hypothetical protein [Clostridium sp. 'White wine YQ']MDD7792711.1 hypothetical protein [Clostridium sp. 'White wine YQ']
MNKKILTIIVIIATAVSVYFILKPLNNENEKGSSVQVNKQTSEKKVANSEKSTKQETKKEDVKTQEEPAKKAEKEDKDDKDDKGEVIPEKSYTDNSKKVKDNEDDALTAAMIFKVDKSTIESKMSLTSKAKLLFYAKRLSSFDFARIKQILASDDEVNGAKEIFRILKSRLNSNEYNEVKGILNPYINTDKIEQYIDT